MKLINEYINENILNGAKFSHTYDYSNAEYEKWKKEISNKYNIKIVNDNIYDYIYINEKTPVHIGTYNKRNHILMCDDVENFGHIINK